jgi:hypothetical protein
MRLLLLKDLVVQDLKLGLVNLLVVVVELNYFVLV